jgi:hypothetical protein
MRALFHRVLVVNQKESFTGFAINMNSGPTSAVVDFTIERWSTDEERNSLLAIIAENPDPTTTLLHALQKLPKVGYIRTPNNSKTADAASSWQPTGRSASGRRAT